MEALGVLNPPRDVRPRHQGLRLVAPTIHGETLYGETTVLDKWESASKDDRRVVHVETVGYEQDGTVACILHRKVMVSKQPYLDACVVEQSGRPTLARGRNCPLASTRG